MEGALAGFAFPRHAPGFRRSSGVHALTAHDTPSILTGRDPDPSRPPIASDHRRNLFTLLADPRQPGGT
jgi:hypothetical protein